MSMTVEYKKATGKMHKALVKEVSNSRAKQLDPIHENKVKTALNEFLEYWEKNYEKEQKLEMVEAAMRKKTDSAQLEIEELQCDSDLDAIVTFDEANAEQNSFELAKLLIRKIIKATTYRQYAELFGLTNKMFGDGKHNSFRVFGILWCAFSVCCMMILKKKSKVTLRANAMSLLCDPGCVTYYQIRGLIYSSNRQFCKTLKWSILTTNAKNSKKHALKSVTDLEKHFEKIKLNY